MPDAASLEDLGARPEQALSPEAAAAMDRVLENPSATQGAIEKDAEDGIVEVKDFSQAADDAEYPEVSSQVKAMADALEQQIRQKASAAQADIDRVRKGEPEPAAPAPEEPVPEPLVAAVEEQAPTAKEVLPPAAEPVVENTPAKEAVPTGQLVQRLSEIAANYQAEKVPLKVLQRQLTKLMGEAGPGEMVALMKQLDGQMKQTAESGKVGDITPIQKGVEGFASPKIETTEADTHDVDEEFSRMHAEATVEKLDPKEVADEALGFARSAVESGGVLSADALMALPTLSAKLAGLEEQGGATEATRTVAAAFEKYRSNPVGLLESMKVYFSEQPDLPKEQWVSEEVIDAKLAERGNEAAQHPDQLANDVGSLAYELMAAGGDAAVISPSFQKTVDEIQNAQSHVAPGNAEWQHLSNAISLLKGAMDARLSPTPASRLRVLKVFAEDAPTLAAAHGLTPEKIDEALATLPAETQLDNLVAANAAQEIAAAGTKAPVAAEVASSESVAAGEDPQRLVKKLGDEAESAFASGDESRLKMAVGEIEGRINGQVASRQKELDALYAVSAMERTPAMQAKIDDLEYSNAIDRKTMDRRRVQLDLVNLQKEKKQADADVASLQADPVADPQKLESLLATQKGLADRIGKKNAQLTELSDTVLQLSRLLERTKLEEKQFEAQPSVSSDKPGPAFIGGGDVAPADKEKKPQKPQSPQTPGMIKTVVKTTVDLLNDMARPLGPS